MAAYNRVQLKLTAKQALRRQRPHPMLITLLYVVLTNVGTYLISSILNAVSGGNTLSQLYVQGMLNFNDPEKALQYALLSYTPQKLVLFLLVGCLLASLLTSLWSGLMRTGYAGFCLGMVRGQQPQTGALFAVFPRWPSVLTSQLLVTVFVTLWTLLFAVGFFVLVIVGVLLLESLPALSVLLFVAAYLGFLVGIVWVSLRYAMVDFLIADQGITGMDAIRESKRLMRGNTGKLFVLDLSFLGWQLLATAAILVGFVPLLVSAAGAANPSADIMAIAALGLSSIALLAVAAIAVSIFNLWLTPYITGAEALFYDHVRGAGSTAALPGGGNGGWDGSYTWTPGPGPQDGPQPPSPPKDTPWE